MLQERQRTTTVDAFVQTEAFTYNVNYVLNGSVINSVNCSIEKKVSEPVPVPGGGSRRRYSGSGTTGKHRFYLLWRRP